MAAANIYAQALSAALKGNIKVGTNAIKCAMFKSTYTPNLATDALYSAIIANESSGTGYSAGGQTVGSPTITTTVANSWATSAAISTAYTAGQVVRPATGNTFLYRAAIGGTSAGTAPTWPTTYGATVVDSGVTWTNIGTNLTQFTGTVPAWTGLTVTDYRYFVFYDSVTSALIAVHDTGGTQSASAITVTYTPDATGVCYLSEA